MTLHPEYVVDENQNRKAVILPLAEWESVVEALDELEDIRLYDAAVQERGEALPFEQALQELK
ncbi:MAG: hypothetical protein ACR2IE_02875 [Candidatus Sumerlaeaceae bacterium]